MARTKTLKPSTTSIIKTRAQSCTGTTPRTGKNNDTTDPVPVTDDLFAGRPKTGTLKDPPPAVPTTGMKPAPRDSDSSDNDAKKPAAKPKGRPTSKAQVMSKYITVVYLH